MFDVGQCATPVPSRAMRATSPSWTCTQWAKPHIGAGPLQLFHPLDRSNPVGFLGVALLIDGLRKVGMQSHPLVPGQLCRLVHQMFGYRKR